MPTRPVALVLVLLIGAISLPKSVFGQGLDPFLPTGTTYAVRFTTPATATANVCLHEVTLAGPTSAQIATAVDVNSDGTIDRADARSCSSGTINTNGTTANTLSLTISPALSRGLYFALRGYPAVGTDPLAAQPSALSNWGVLGAILTAPTVLSP